MTGRAVHGVDVGEIDHGGFVAQMTEWGVDEVEVDALHEHIGGDESLFAFGGSDDGAVVAYALQGAGLSGLDAFGEVANKTKFAK